MYSFSVDLDPRPTVSGFFTVLNGSFSEYWRHTESNENENSLVCIDHVQWPRHPAIDSEQLAPHENWSHATLVWCIK